MKQVLTITILIGLHACSRPSHRPDNVAKASDSVYVQQPVETSETDGCGFNRFINDSNTSQLARSIFLDRKWDLSRDHEALPLLDSLTAVNKASRAFYFKVITKSYKGTDGYFTEALGHAGKEYIAHHTAEFAAYFENRECFSDADLETWADIVILEFGMIHEGGYNKPVVEDYLKTLETNCNTCTTSQKGTISRFGRILKKKWNEFLRNIE